MLVSANSIFNINTKKKHNRKKKHTHTQKNRYNKKKYSNSKHKERVAYDISLEKKKELRSKNKINISTY